MGPRAWMDPEEMHLRPNEGQGLTGLFVVTGQNPEEDPDEYPNKEFSLICTEQERHLPPKDSHNITAHARLLKKMSDILDSQDRLLASKYTMILGFAIGPDNKFKKNSCANIAWSGGRGLSPDQESRLQAIWQDSEQVAMRHGLAGRSSEMLHLYSHSLYTGSARDGRWHQTYTPFDDR